MYKFIPEINYQRHKPYLSAFDNKITIYNYLHLIKAFILDKHISPNNAEDLQLLRDILFETKFGKNHIYFYDYFSRRKSKDNIKLLSKYSEYLLIMSELFLDDMFHHILRTRDKYLINNYFTYLSNKNKLNFIKIAKIYPHIINKFPKIKTYMVFI